MDFPHKILITGTGRAGTTFLVQLLTELGLDTGYTVDEARRRIDPHSHAGLEHDLPRAGGRPTVRHWLRQPKHMMRALWREAPPTPYIIKNPALCDSLGEIMASRRFVIDHVYIPLRDLEAAALSRAHVGGCEGSKPGGLWKTGDSRQQKAVLAEMFFRLVHTLTMYDVPHTFLLFPRLVEDWAYAYAKLSFLVQGIDRETFRAAFARVAVPELVHQFAAAAERRMPAHPAKPRLLPELAGTRTEPRLPAHHWLQLKLGWRAQGAARL